MRLYLITPIALLTVANTVAANSAFDRPEELEPAIEFWRRVYTEITTEEGFIHDNRYLGVVYEVIELPSQASRRTRQRKIDNAKKHYQRILAKLAGGKRSGLTAEEQRVLDLWPEDVSNSTLKDARHRMRFQLGQADKFRQGLIRSGVWEPYIRRTLEEMGAPVELAALPHVESSYNPAARSHVGASGLWQFTRSTGRRFLRIDHVVDERRDPYLSTVAAGRLLLQNYSVTGTWPLAITAYNHGASGMRRAKRKLGTDDIATVVRDYRSRTFGFASRNFYVAFLAAYDVSSNPEKYFGSIRRDPPDDSLTVTVPDYFAVDSLIRGLDIDRNTLEAYNPALMPAVWKGTKRVPRGYELRVPRTAITGSVSTAFANIPDSERYSVQTRDVYHTVQRGETLSQIATYYRVSQAELVALNNLRSRHRIRAGQVLRLPVTDTATVVVAGEIPEEGVYVVRRGDSVSAISKRFGVPEEDLLAMNQIQRKNLIYAGQRLVLVPEDEQVGAETAASAEADTEVILATTEPKAVVSAVVETEPVTEDTSVTEASEPAEPPSITPSPTEEEQVQVAMIEDFEVTEDAVVEETSLAVTEQQEPLSTTVAVALDVLAADPSDYTVGDDQTIEIQAAETLGHYAEWLDLRASQLRRINGMRYGTPVVIGKRLRLDFSEVEPEEFEQRRLEYHRILQEQFFTRFRITGTEKHVVREGDMLWVLTQRRYHVPVWLLRQYNPDLNLAFVHPGAEVTFPVLAEVSAAD